MVATRSTTRSTSSTRPAPATCSRRAAAHRLRRLRSAQDELSRPGSKSSSRRATTTTSSRAAASPAAASAPRPRSPLGVTPIARLHRLRHLRGGLSRPGRHRDADRGPASRRVRPPNFGFLPNPGAAARGRQEQGNRRQLCVTTTSRMPGRRVPRQVQRLPERRHRLHRVDVVGVPGALCSGTTFCFQYQNIPSARIEGWEFDTNYDAGSFLPGVRRQPRPRA